MQVGHLKKQAAGNLAATFVLALFAGGAASGASAATFNTLYNFCSQNGCADGSGAAGLTEDASGNLYGTAAGGGEQDKGAVFKLTPGGNNSWTYTVLYSFCVQNGCADGATPSAPPIVDTKGNLYGTTYFGGAANKGIAFELVFKKRGPYQLKVLYNFCSQTNCTDGANPSTGLAYKGSASGTAYNGKLPLLGTTFESGPYGDGVVFALSPGAKGVWTEKTAYAFCPGGGLCTDGALPVGNLLVNTKGDVYGTTAQGGANGSGEVYELAPSGQTWKESLLYSFCSQPECADGGGGGSLVMNTSGDFYGTTSGGGAQSCGGGCGIAFELAPSGKKYVFSLLYDFCSQPNCTDGMYPNGNLVLDGSGNLYGTTFYGGSKTFEQDGGGILYELSGTTLQILHDFCISPCSDGGNPSTGVLIDKSGDLFGTTANYGAISGGTVYEETGSK